MDTQNILKLSGRKLRSAAMPLGGIGTGSIAIGGDGILKQWQISNNVRHLAFVPNSFFGIWTKKQGDSSENAISRALICKKVHEIPDFKPAETVSDHIIGVGMKDMIDRLPGVDDIQFDGEYPVAFLKYLDKSLPVDISLTAFNPFIPLDPKNSGLPLIIFKFSIVNKSNSTYEISLMGSFLNFIGWKGVDAFKGNSYKYFGGNFNKYCQIGNWPSIEMKSEMLLKNDRRYGDLVFAIDQETALKTLQWGDLTEFWNFFSQNGELPTSKSEELSPIGETWAGSLASKKVLKSKEQCEITFVLAWNFPNRVADWIETATINSEDITEFWIGNRYNEWFKNAQSVIKYLQANWTYLFNKTEQFHKNFYTTTLPPEVLTSISGPMSILRSPSCFWIRDGSFHGFEGCHGASTTSASGGCCPLDCTHVWNYEFTIAHLFPTLEYTMRGTEFKLQQNKGYLVHRSILPLYLPQIGYKWEKIPPAIDGMLGSILKNYRDYLISKDLDVLKLAWPMIKRLMEYIFTSVDKKAEGVIYGEQPNTYDCSIYGINTFIGSLYLTALLVCEKITQFLSIPDWPLKFRTIYDSGRKILDQECWNGEYYIQKYDETQYKKRQFGIGCHSDQLFGQWWAFELGLGYILPPDHVKKAINSIVKYNFKESLEGIKQMRIFASATDSGLLNCTWPHGGEPAEPTFYTNEVWTGIEYEVATLCVYVGEIPSALKLINSIRTRYDGLRRSPWNEVECGDHYVRAMASWTLLHAFTGMDYDEDLKQFTLDSKMNSTIVSTFFVTKSAWGQVTQQNLNSNLIFKITISYGDLNLKSIKLKSIDFYHPQKIHVSIHFERTISGTIIIKGSEIEIQMSELVNIHEQQQIVFEIN